MQGRDTKSESTRKGKNCRFGTWRNAHHNHLKHFYIVYID